MEQATYDTNSMNQFICRKTERIQKLGHKHCNYPFGWIHASKTALALCIDAIATYFCSTGKLPPELSCPIIIINTAGNRYKTTVCACYNLTWPRSRVTLTSL